MRVPGHSVVRDYAIRRRFDCGERGVAIAIRSQQLEGLRFGVPAHSCAIILLARPKRARRPPNHVSPPPASCCRAERAENIYDAIINHKELVLYHIGPN